MIPFFQELFEYNHLCNEKLIGHFLEHQEFIPRRSLTLFSHILNAQHIWNARIRQQLPQYAVWEVHDQQNFTGINQTNYKNTISILQNYSLEAPFFYKNSTGKEFSNSVKDTLFHVVNHSTYHRGQITSDLRANGIDPVPTDYILFKR